jgi:glyoxylase-like metal-dependent hydrolase (beta-lactamase superfamily II)
MAAEVRELQSGLYLIQGHHPVSMWTDINVPNIVMVHAGETLYLLDSGLGPEQKQAILDVAGQLKGQFTRLVLLNSHGHADHTGNNDVLEDIDAPEKQHYISELSTPYFDSVGFFRDAYNEGARYFDYLQGLNLTIDGLMPLLVRAGLDPRTDSDQLADLGRRISRLGLTRVISHYWGDLMMRNIGETYPPMHPSLETMRHYETLPGETFEYGDARWTGWRVGDVCVFQGHGHTADGVLFYLPDHKFLFFADETTTIPIWKDTDTDNTARSFHNTLSMVGTGAIESLVAGHFPLQVVSGAEEMRATITAFLNQKLDFDREVIDGVAQFPDGVGIDELYSHLSGQAQGVVARLAEAQFPKMPSFLKLTLLNFCRQHLTEVADGAGRPTFKVAA